MKMIALLSVCALVSANSYASDWNGAVYVGATHSGSTTATTTVSGVSGSATSTDTTQAALDLGVDYFRRTNSPVNLAIIIEDAWYSAKGVDADFTLSVMPGLRIESGTSVNAWMEIAAGPSLTKIGTTSSTVGAVTAQYNSSNVFAFVFSPRVGVDFSLNDKYFIGFQFAYYTGSGSLNGTTTGGGPSSTFSVDETRHYFSTAVRFGCSFGDNADDDTNKERADQRPPAPPMNESTEAKEESPKKIDADELMKLKKLRDAHAITEKEYQDQKAKILK